MSSQEPFQSLPITKFDFPLTKDDLEEAELLVKCMLIAVKISWKGYKMLLKRHFATFKDSKDEQGCAYK